MHVKNISICIAITLVALNSAAPARRSTLSDATEVFPQTKSDYAPHKNGLTEDLISEDLDLDDVTDHGVDLDDVTDHGVDLDDVTDHGADLDDVTDHGADLDNVTDHGADLDNVTDHGADLDNVTDHGVGLDDVDDIADNDVVDKVNDKKSGILGDGIPVVGSVLGKKGGLPLLGSAGLPVLG